MKTELLEKIKVLLESVPSEIREAVKDRLIQDIQNIENFKPQGE